VPSKRSSPESRRLLGEDQEGELKGFGEADVLELNGRGPGGAEVFDIQRSAEASIGRATGGHANACSQKGRKGAFATDFPCETQIEFPRASDSCLGTWPEEQFRCS
jgi:hypothetical protein